MKKKLLILSILCALISCKKDSTEPVIALKSITLSSSNLELLLGSSATLTTTTLPVEAPAVTLYWSSSDSTTVKVDNSGRLNALNLGEATVTVKNADGKVSSTCTVVVKPIAVTGIVLDKTALTLILGTKDKLTVAFEPTNTTNQKITWSTSNALVVKVDQQGNIEATGVGAANILAITEDGITSAVCKISVGLPGLTGLTIDKKDVQLYPGGDIQYAAITNPPNAQPEEMIWSSSDVTVASVSSSGLAKALKAGKTTIKVSNKAGTISASTELTVLPNKVSSISLNKTIVGLLVGGTETLTTSVLPTNADNKNIVWNNSNNTVISVDNTGKITALSLGTAVVSVTPADGSSAVAHCTVVVSTIDKLVKIAAKPNSLVFSGTGNSSRLSTGIYNSSSSPIAIISIKIFINGVLSRNYSFTDPALSSASYVYDLGPFALASGAIDMSTLMLGWTVQFEYENRGTLYTNTVAVKSNTVGQVNSNDFGSTSARSNLKPINVSLRRSASVNLR
jgi:uncharacterized protein YjdB